MKKGVSAIIYDSKGEGYFLILHRKSNWEGWEFCKGGIMEGETSETAVRREVTEETGLRRVNLKGKLNIQRRFEADGKKHVFDVYVVQANMNIPIHINRKEHDNFLWATKQRVLEKLTWTDEKKVFEKAVTALWKFKGKKELVTEQKLDEEN